VSGQSAPGEVWVHGVFGVTGETTPPMVKTLQNRSLC
jgi:hypothetical protein